MIFGDPGEDRHGLRPHFYLRLQPTPFCLPVPDLSPQVTVPHHHTYPQPPKVLLCPGCIPWGHNQDALGQLRVVASGRSPRLEVPAVLQYVLELPSRPCVISVPWMSDPGVGALKLPDEGEDPDAICNHG